MPQVSKNKIIWDYRDFVLGVNPAFSTSPTTTPIPGAMNGLTAESGVNPFRNFGYLSPGVGPGTIPSTTQINTGPIMQICVGDPGSNYFGITYGDSSTKCRLYNIPATLTTTTGSVSTIVVNGAGGATATMGYSCVNYYGRVGGTRTRLVFYSYNQMGTAYWDVGIINPVTLAQNDNFMTTLPATPLTTSTTNSDAHPLFVGEDDVLYMGDRNLVHAYDGGDSSDVDGKFFSSVLTLPSNKKVVGFAKYQNKLVIFAMNDYVRDDQTYGTGSSTRVEGSTAYFWDYKSLDPDFAVQLEDGILSAPFSYRGTIGCFTQGFLSTFGSNQVSKLRIFNGVEFEVAATYDGPVPALGGVEVQGSVIYWHDGIRVMSYGSPVPGYNSALHKIIQLDTPTNSTTPWVGALKSVSNNVMVASNTQTVTSQIDSVMQVLQNGICAGHFRVEKAQPSFSVGRKGQVKSVKVTFGANTSTNGNGISLYLIDSSGTSSTIADIGTIDATNRTKEYYVDTSGSPFPKFSDLAVYGTWVKGGSSSSLVPFALESIEVDYDETNIEGT